MVTAEEISNIFERFFGKLRRESNDSIQYGSSDQLEAIIRSYQNRNGLEITGKIDIRTVNRLLVDGYLTDVDQQKFVDFSNQYRQTSFCPDDKPDFFLRCKTPDSISEPGVIYIRCQESRDTDTSLPAAGQALPQVKNSKETYVLQDLIQNDITTFLSTPTAAGSVTNKLRENLGYFWFYDPESQLESLKFYKTSKDIFNYDLNIATSVFSSRPAPVFRENLDISEGTNGQSGFTEDPAKSFIVNFDPALFKQAETDIVFTVDLPLEQKNRARAECENGDTSLTCEIINDYNFYLCSYERLFNNTIPTNALPNFYILLTEYLYTDPRNGNIQPDAFMHDAILTFSSSVDLQFGEQYFDEFAKDVSGLLNINNDSQQVNYVTNKMQNVVFPSEEMAVYQEFEEKKEQFPIYSEIIFDTEKVGTIGKVLREAGLTDYIISYFADLHHNQGENERLFSIGSKESPTRKNVEVPVTPFMQAIEDLEEQKHFNTNNITYLGQLENKIKQYNNAGLPDLTALFYFELNFEDFKNEKSRLVKNILDGQVSYDETLFYRIDKYEVVEDDQGNESSQKIQSFYVSNTEEIQKLKIIDSQLRYGNKYRYEVYSYLFVLGNEWKNIQKTNDADINLENYPNAYIVQTFYCELESLILDKPPAPPEVEPISYKDNDKNVMFLFNPSTMRYRLKEIPFNEMEADDYAKIRMSQQLLPEEKIEFGGDDKIDFYHAYRIDYHPSSYSDFYDALYANIATKENCTTAEFLDTIQPNKKYYYIFRAVDIHGHVSNPTDVHQIEMINEDDSIFLTWKVVEFIDKEYKKLSKDMKRFVHIKPAVLQEAINEQPALNPQDLLNILNTPSNIDTNNRSLRGTRRASTAKQALDSVTLGKLERSVWSKKFKIRVKSKNTNKFIDILYSFDIERNPQIVENSNQNCED